jgi:hypothetical protein
MMERAEFTFKAKEYASGMPWILAQSISGPDIIGGTLGFDLTVGTTFEEAKEIAAYMRKHIRGLALTRQPTEGT